MICNPSACNYEEQFNEWKKANGIIGKQKRIVVRQGQVVADENTNPIAKIVFLKDTDIENSEFEEQACGWLLRFEQKMRRYCANAPGYSELRPLRFSV